MIPSIIVILLMVWFLFIIAGVVIHALFWLTIVGLALFAVTAAGGALHHRRTRR